MIKTTSERGFAPIIALIIILLAGVSAAVYVNSNKDKPDLANTRETATTTAQKAEPAQKTATAPAVKTATAPQTKVVSAPPTPTRSSIATSDIQYASEALNAGRDLVCSKEGPLAGNGEILGTVKSIDYFTPKFPKRHAEVKYYYHKDGRKDYTEARVKDYSDDRLYIFRVEKRDATWDEIFSTPGHIGDSTNFISSGGKGEGAAAQVYLGGPCLEQSFDYNILDVSKYTYGKSYTDYRKSGKNWECTYSGDNGRTVTRFSSSFSGWTKMGYDAGGNLRTNQLTNLNEKKRYEWGPGFNNTYYTYLLGYCQIEAYELPTNQLKNCVEKEQDATFFVAPTAKWNEINNATSCR